MSEPAIDAIRVIRDEAELRALLGEPSDLVRAKLSDRVTKLTRAWIDRSPFVLLATSAPDGTCDVSPRGDPPGFVRVLDERTLLLPERPGNRLADSLRNILENPRVGLLFVVPGVGDTLRVNGRARLVRDEELLAPSAVEGRVPKLGILVEVEEVFTHCAKVFLRAQLWDASRHLDRSELPSYGAIHASRDPSFDAEAYDAERAGRYARREGFY